MDSTKTTYASFPFEWTVKSTSHQIQYRKAENINEIDEIFCSIINARGNQIEFSKLGNLLGFNLQDLAETDIFNIYLKSISDYNLITISQKIIHLTEFGEEALQTKLKYKYFFASTELFENQAITGESFDFSFKTTFDLDNKLSVERVIKIETLDKPELKQKLQFQLFGNDIYKGEIIELYESNSYINYKSISLQCKITALEDSFQLSIYKSSANKPELQFLIDLPENEEFKSKLIRKGMYHHILLDKNSITVQDIKAYIDLWNWKELAENPKTDWNDKTIFKLFLENGDGSVWSAISEKAPIGSIQTSIQEYAEYWNWTTLTERFDNGFIKEQIEIFNWDFEELSYKETELVISLLSNAALKDRDWDWNYLSKNLPDKFIEETIEDFAWDFYEITISKNDVFKNTFIKYEDKLEIIISKNWNWQYISGEIDLNFLHKNISGFASKINWHLLLNRFFNDEKITAKCLKDDYFKSLLKQHLPDNFIIAHQKCLWTLDLIDFFEQQKLIQWESKTYIKGFDTNENVEWSRDIFEKYHNRITTDSGFLNVSQQISDYSLIEEFPDFAWNWKGISANKNLIENAAFIENAFVGNFSFTDDLLWDQILINTNFEISFWNEYLEVFDEVSVSSKHLLFWKLLTQKENLSYILVNNHFPWDWTFITENSTDETILDSFDDKELFEKWDWEIATRKLDKETILDNLEGFTRFIDWKFLINVVFSIENEFSMDKQLPRIAACLSVVDTEIRKDVWKDLTIKIPFGILFPIVEETIQSNVFEWDWDFISNHTNLPTDSNTIIRFKQKINWSVFSNNRSIKRKFEFKKEEWSNFYEYRNYVLKYLSDFQDLWDWNILTMNSNLHYNREFIEIFERKWDWKYLSEYGGLLIRKKKDEDNYLLDIITKFPLVEFEFLSKRKDINIDSGLILATKDKNWDWQVLSENEKVEISNELILELRDKTWDWKAISKRKNITFNNETILQLLEKDWDWSYLSENPNFEFNTYFIGKTKTKSWNWIAVSRHKTFLPIIEILTLTKDFDLDWEYLSKHSSLNPTKELLAKFENKWDWWSITQNPQINFFDIDFIERFADKWNWRFICESGKLILNNQILNQFKDYLKWDSISSNTNINFTKEIIQEFRQYWNWTALKNNKRVGELLGSYVTDEISKSSTLNFIDKIEQQNSQWKGHIYHFSHIDNAVQIIRERKIKSRTTANQMSDSAGNVVHSRIEAHKFARFYFRPHTQTQFYNEFLGVDINMGFERNGERHSWYQKEYRYLDFPKCPTPIYFEFSLQEVLFKMFEKCNVSTGNMQRNRSKYGNIEQMIHLFNFEDLFINPGMVREEWKKFGEFAQQELMIQNEFDFSNINYFKIICASSEDRKLLIQLLGADSIDVMKNIIVDRLYYRNENPSIEHNVSDDEICISSKKQADGYFILTTENASYLEIIDGDLIKREDQKVTFKSFIKIKNQSNIVVKYVDEINQEWFVFSNYELKPKEYDDIRVKTSKFKKSRIMQFSQ